MHCHLPPRLAWLKQRPFPLPKFCCLKGLQYCGLLRLLTRHPAGLHFFSLYPQSRWMWATDRVRSPLFHRPLSQHPAPPYAGGFFAAAIQVLHHFHGLRYQSVTRLPLAPLSGLTLRRCRIHLMLRAAVLLLFLRGLHRFNTSGHPDALDACYVAPWRLPRPDLHRLAER